MYILYTCISDNPSCTDPQIKLTISQFYLRVTCNIYKVYIQLCSLLPSVWYPPLHVRHHLFQIPVEGLIPHITAWRFAIMLCLLSVMLGQVVQEVISTCHVQREQKMNTWYTVCNKYTLCRQTAMIGTWTFRRHRKNKHIFI